ncbi:MAG: glycosyltransferase, partial [Alphaproteobacteria bacterium]|nr:glycosyltransferase [Alphaproteobacteria bacterium]
DLGLSTRIAWMGAQPQEMVLSELRRADIFILPSKQTADGDRDGLPNVLMEAQSQQVAVISTNMSGIPELVINGETGVLVAPGDSDALSAALKTLIENPILRAKLAQAGFDRVHARFSMDAGIDTLCELFDPPAAAA